MSKRKRSTSKETPPATPSEGSEGAPTVHVSSDVLAGSPDIWAPGKDKPVESSDAASEEAAPPAETEPAGEEPPSMSAEGPAATEDEQQAETVATEPAVSPPPPPAYQPRPPAYVAPGPAPRRPGSSVAFGVVLVVLRLFALLVQFTGFDAGQSWPLFVVIPGLTLLVVGYISLGTGALIPGAILTIIGLMGRLNMLIDEGQGALTPAEVKGSITDGTILDRLPLLR